MYVRKKWLDFWGRRDVYVEMGEKLKSFFLSIHLSSHLRYVSYYLSHSSHPNMSSFLVTRSFRPFLFVCMCGGDRWGQGGGGHPHDLLLHCYMGSHLSISRSIILRMPLSVCRSIYLPFFPPVCIILSLSVFFYCIWLLISNFSSYISLPFFLYLCTF